MIALDVPDVAATTPIPSQGVGGTRRGRADDSRRGTGVGRTASAMGTGILCLIAVVLLGVVAGAALGYRPLVIRSGSMTPTIGVGSVVVSDSIHPLQARPGDIVTFRDPAIGQQLVTHRVVRMQRAGPTVEFVTKGDANHTTEHWTVPVAGTIGREVLVIPSVGRWLTMLNLPLARVLEILGAMVLVGFLLFHWIWLTPEPARARRGPPDGDRLSEYPAAV
jgi:signal peptidase I